MNIDKESSLADLLLVFRRNIIDAIRKEGLNHDLTFSQVEVLRFVGPDGKQTMRKIADYLKITPPSVTEIITDMEKKGLVKRVSDTKDRRVVYIVFTNTAKKLFALFSKRKEIILKKMTARLEIKDRKNLERIIRILVTE